MSLVSTAARGSGSSSGGGLSLIGSQTLVADAASVSVTSIPSTFGGLYVRALVRSTVAAATDTAVLRFNADATAGHYLTGQFQNNAGTGATSQNSTATGVALGNICAASTTAGFFSAWEFWINGYDSATYMTDVNGQGSMQIASGILTYQTQAVWNQTTVVAAVSLLPITGPNLLAGSRLFVYGYSLT